MLDVDVIYKFLCDIFVMINIFGFFGEQYVGFEVGGDDVMLKVGDIIKKIQDVMVFEKLISQFMYNKVLEDGSK